MTDLAIRIATTMDSTGLLKADKQVKSFEKTVKGLGKTLGLTLSAAAFVQFGRKSVQAFIEAEKANTKLANSVKNLGLSFAQAEIQSNLDKISAATGIAGEPLAQAFQSLLTTTGSVNKSLELLRLSLDVSAGSGVELIGVTQDISNAYLGNTRSLRKYNLGLTQAELKTVTFTKVQERLNAQFSGANAAYLDTYAGKMQILTEAAGTAQERLGGAIIDFGMAFTGSSNIDQLIGKINTLTDKTVGFLDRITEGVRILNAIRNSSLNTIQKNIQDAQVEEFNRRMRRDYMKAWDGVNIPQSSAQLAAQRAAEAAARKRAEQIRKEQEKQTKELKKQNTLKRAGTLFDQTQIGIIAALKGNISKEDRLRLELQLALATENVSEVEKLGKELAISQGLGQELAKFLTNLPSAKNPFDAWKSFLDDVESQAARIAKMQFQTANFQYTVPTGNFTYGQGNPLNTNVFVDPRGAGAGGSTVVVNVAGSVTTSQNLIDEIRGGLNVAALSGSSANVERRIGGW